MLRDVYELSHDAIAEELGISATAAKVRLHRARHKLRSEVFPELDQVAPPCGVTTRPACSPTWSTAVRCPTTRRRRTSSAACAARRSWPSTASCAGRLAQLRVQLLDPGPDLLDEVLAAIGTAGQPRVGRSALHRHRAAYVAAATAATAAGAVLLASRTRRTRLGLTG